MFICLFLNIALICVHCFRKNSDLKIALWTGYEWDEIKYKEVIKYIDIVVTGEYIDDLHCDYKISKNILDKKRGSTNQKIINAKESLHSLYYI